MTTSLNNSQPANDVSKMDAYGEHIKGRRWQRKLYKTAAYKSLDIPEDDMVLNVMRGIGWKEILAVGALIAGGGWAIAQFRPQVPVAYPPQVPVFAPAEKQDFVDTDTDSGLIDIGKRPKE